MRSIVFAMGLMAASTAWAQSPAPPAADKAMGPGWTAVPSITDVKAVYPPLARQQHVEGMVLLSCRVTATGALEACSVLKEGSPGSGFGQAALALVPKYRMNPKAPDGQSMEGATVALPVRFQITEEGPGGAPQ